MSFLKKLIVAVLVSFVTGFLAYILGFLYAGGKIIKWQSLGKPPEQVVRIAGTTMGSVTVETVSKKLYVCEDWSQTDCWSETAEIPVDLYSDKFGCKFDALKPDGDIVYIQQSCFMDPGGVSFSTYTLRQDGNVYVKHGRNALSGKYAWAVWLNFILGTILGFIGTWIFFLFRWFVKLP